MSHTFREQRTAYDNIAVGSAVSDEEHFIVGEDPPAQTYGGNDNLAVGETSRDPDNNAAGVSPPDENIAVGG